MIRACLQMADIRAIRIPATAAGLLKGREALERFCAEEGLKPDDRWRLQVAFDEIVSNIARHAARERQVDIHAAFRHDGATVQMDIEDDGPPFDPLAQPAPNVIAPLQERVPGGLGIMLVRQLMDRVEYRREGRNIVRLTRHV